MTRSLDSEASLNADQMASRFTLRGIRLPKDAKYYPKIMSLDSNRHLKVLLNERPISVKEEVFHPGGTEPLHRHLACWQIFIGLEGELLISASAGNACLRKDTVVCIAPGTKHTAENRTSKSARFLIVSSPDPEFDRELIGPESSTLDHVEYSRTLVNQVGDRDPVQVLADTPQSIRQAIEDVEPGILEIRPFAEKWTSREVILHFVDSAMNRSLRFRMIMSGGHPVLPGYDEKELVKHRSEQGTSVIENIELFSLTQRSDVALLERFRHRFDLPAHHLERGETTLGDLVRLEAGHDLHHLDQLRRYVKAAREMK